MSEAEKKLERAKKFNIQPILSVDEKKNIRAERYKFTTKKNVIDLFDEIDIFC